MRNRDMVSGIFLSVLSIGTCIMAYRLGLGRGSSPGPGFAAFGIAILLGLLSISLFLKGVFQITRSQEEMGIVKGLLWKKPFLILILLVGYGLFLNTLGFSLSTFLLMIFLIWGAGRQRLRLALTVSIITVVSSYLLFIKVLGLPLPIGSIWFFIGG